MRKKAQTVATAQRDGWTFFCLRPPLIAWLIADVRQRMRRTVIAFIVAPLIPAAFFIRDAGPMLAVVLSYFWSYLLGVPTFCALRRFKKERHLVYGLVGFSLGFLVLLVQGPVTRSEFIAASAIGGIGAITALAFSLIRGPQRKNAELATANGPKRPWLISNVRQR